MSRDTAENDKTSPTKSQRGFHDTRHGVSFPEGFEIFRVYLSKPYRAVATGGSWHLNDGRKFQSLNQLSRAVGPTTENAWVNWMYLNEKGLRRPLSDFRNPPQPTATKGKPMSIKTTWRDDTVAGLREIGGRGSLAQIYNSVRRVRKSAHKTLPPSSDDVVRRTLEENCSDTDSYKGLYDLFYMPEGKGAGVWALR
ncbi:MAG TPA: hypothetical protein VMF58_07375 [Rhizomicrobium sp.]|nr:hypothetical protein [Rhizomicrobium sp.]